jgi:hypothetical protein
MRVQHALSMVLSRHHTNHWHKRHWSCGKFHREHGSGTTSLWTLVGQPRQWWVRLHRQVPHHCCIPRRPTWSTLVPRQSLLHAGAPGRTTHAKCTSDNDGYDASDKEHSSMGVFFFFCLPNLQYDGCVELGVLGLAPRQACGTASRRVEQNVRSEQFTHCATPPTRLHDNLCRGDSDHVPLPPSCRGAGVGGPLGRRQRPFQHPLLYQCQPQRARKRPPGSTTRWALERPLGSQNWEE